MPLSDELKTALALEPMPGGVKYIISTQVRWACWTALPHIPSRVTDGAADRRKAPRVNPPARPATITHNWVSCRWGLGPKSWMTPRLTSWALTAC